MPGLVQRSVSQFGNATAGTCSSPVAAAGSVLANGVWAKQRDGVAFDQLQKFWSELPPHARQELLRMDKHTLFEQARKNMYCSRCNGLLLEGFTQIVLYGKSLQQEAGVAYLHNKIGDLKNEEEKESDEVQAHDPSVHPWGGLVASRDGTLTLMDCFIHGKSLWVLQNVFDSARARERERELLYPDACGGGGRGWISHGMANYGRVHGARETCALHTARLSCDTLVDFWSALGNETRLSLLRMKEEDFIERLMYRFDSKRFCRDCRKNVTREFKELKELKRMRRETRCTSWFCVADTAFQYEVSRDTVQADWRHSFTDSSGIYHHFEWAIGTAEGKSDILEFKDAGLTGEAQVKGVELEGLDACFVTLRAWRLDGRCTELTVKAHALKGKPCVHRRLVVGDGFVTISKGENIRSFFERAEEAEEEEDDDSIDKDGNELDGDGSRPQKHAKSPELAREFLLDAATVIFKEQVEKAFREGTARQNAHSIFVCLALKLLEERVHVACKEIITLEKQVKLLEEEEKEKREEEERRERRRAKEREKKHRRKERLRGKEHEREQKDSERERKDSESDLLSTVIVSKKESSTSAHEETLKIFDKVDPNNEVGGSTTASAVSDGTVEQFRNGSTSSETQDLNNALYSCHDGEMNDSDTNGAFILEQSKSFRRKLRSNQNLFSGQASESSGKHQSAIDNEDNVLPSELESTLNGYSNSSSRCISGGHRHSRANIVKTSARNCGPRFNEKFHCSKSWFRERYDYQSCSCNHHVDYRAKGSQLISTVRRNREIKAMNKTETPLNASRSVFRSNKYSYGSYAYDNSVAPKPKPVLANNNNLHTKKVWEPTDSWKKYLKNESDPTLSSRTQKIDPPEQNGSVAQIGHEEPRVISSDSSKPGLVKHDDSRMKTSDSIAGAGNLNDSSDAFHLGTKPSYCKDVGDEEVDSCSVSPTSPIDNLCDHSLSSSSSENCSSCLSEADSSSSSSTARNVESSSTSDSEDVSQQFEGRDIPIYSTSQGNNKDCEASFSGRTMVLLDCCSRPNILRDNPVKDICNSDCSLYGYEMARRQQQVLPMHNHNLHSSYGPFPTMSYHNQSSASWSATANNGVSSFAQPHHYLFPSPIGYGLPANQPLDFCTPYNGLQPVVTPMLHVRSPVYQTVKQVNIHNSSEKMKNCKVDVNQLGNDMANANKSVQTLERASLDGQQSKPPSTGENGNGGVSSKSVKENPSFSLFHFGGPIAVASGSSLDSLSLKNESTQEADINNAHLKKDTAVEEYSLFASRNGSRFSFF